MTSFENERALGIDRLLHPGERDQFLALCVSTSEIELLASRDRIRAHVRALAERAATSSTVDIEMAKNVAAAILALLSDTEHYDAEQRALIRGAIDYFVLTQDNQDDVSDLTGFDDDARITNAVTEALGREDLAIDIS